MKRHQMHQEQKGFTLIEAMVAIAIFTIVMVIGISALLNVNSTNKKSQNLRAIIDNLDFAMEDMSRNFKLGSYYHCVTGGDPQIVDGQVNDFLATSQDCVTATNHEGSLIAALEPMQGIPADSTTGAVNANDQVVYRFVPAAGNNTSNCILEKSINGGQAFTPITPYPEIKIDCGRSGFNIYNTQNSSSFAASPRVIIRISGVVVYKDVVTPFNLQTSASQRNINVVTP